MNDASPAVLPHPLSPRVDDQERRNAALLAGSPVLGTEIRSAVLPLALDLERGALGRDEDLALAALEKEAATTAIEALVSLARAGDIDHLGGGLELIPALLLTLASVDYERRQFVIEHGHTSIGYYAALAALGFLPKPRVVEAFRRSLDMAGHVSWVPGGTPLGSGRLGVMVPASAGLALGLKAHHGPDGWVICHCGDAGWISGQALNGFIGASLHGAPVTFVMHRNGIQLSGPTARVLDRDPRPVIERLGVRILEIPSLHERPRVVAAYAEARRLARAGQPALIYPVGWRSTDRDRVTVRSFGERYGIADETAAFAARHGVPLDSPVWIPGSLMSYRDPHAMLECLFLVNNLPGGEGHHDGGMKGRDAGRVLANPMLQMSGEERQALDRLRQKPARVVVTRARPPRGTPNLALDAADVRAVPLPGAGASVSVRAGTEAAYALVARTHPERCFFVSCDLNPSTKLGKAAGLVAPGRQFEMGIQEQAAALMVDGLSLASREPQLNVFATFAAFVEGIAREGLEMWRYQRNLDGRNDGLNVLMHLSHVGACTGRDHFSGWGLDWITLGLGYLPFLRRFYVPADARAGFLAVTDAASAMGGHLIAVPRDNLPVLARPGSSAPVWDPLDPWTPATHVREQAGAAAAVLALGAPSFMALEAAERAGAAGTPADVWVVNGFPLDEDFFAGLARRYRRVVTVEDGLIGTPASGLRGFAGVVASHLCGSGLAVSHVGIVDPRVAPSDHYLKVWEHYGMTSERIAAELLGRP